jgi:hypothetical protein
MGKVKVSIEIKASAVDVFSLVQNSEKVVTLMPSDWQINVEKLTEGPIREGTGHRIRAKKGLLGVDYKDRVEEIVENQKIITRTGTGA